MKNIKVWVFSAMALSAPVPALAGELEKFCAGAEKAFLGPSLQVNASLPAPAVPAAPEIMKAGAGAAEYKKLAAAFEKGTAPAKADLAGWNAGRFLERDYPDYPGSLLLASVEIPAAPAGAGSYKIVAFTLDGSPAFYETLNPDLNAGLAALVRERLPMWTNAVFTQAELTFERVLPSYEKGFSRYAVRKAADGRVLVKNAWRSELGGSVTEGVFYAYLTKNVTPAYKAQKLSQNLWMSVHSDPSWKEASANDYAAGIEVRVRKVLDTAFNTDIKVDWNSEWVALNKLGGNFSLSGSGLDLRMTGLVGSYNISGSVTDANGQTRYLNVTLYKGQDTYSYSASGIGINLNISRTGINGGYEDSEYSKKAMAGIVALALAAQVDRMPAW